MKKWHYYNDSDKVICKWVKNLIAAGVVPDGEVDERPIEQVESNDVQGFVQAHFFCGILGWPLALRLAGWPDDRPVWTGSCPCQPFSSAGKRQGHKDKRHLWPELHRLIGECNPRTVFGEQVASRDGLGWIDGVSLDLEAVGYAVAACDLPAACVGAPHIRQRLWWVADTASGTGQRHLRSPPEMESQVGRRQRVVAADSGATSGVDNPAGARHNPARGGQPGEPEGRGSVPGVGCPWRDSIPIPCADGKPRRISPEPSLFPLATRIPGRVGLLRGAGNAIVPQVAAKFIRAYMDVALSS